MAIDLSLFPTKPTYAGRWWSISFEPIVGSGERINAIIVVRGDDGKIDIIQSIRDEVLEAIYGTKSDAIKEMIIWVKSSLQTYISSHFSLSGWSSPISGFSVSRDSKALDDTLSGIVKQAVRLTASLGTLTLEAIRDEEDYLPNQKQSEQWATKISDETRLLNPKLADFFGSRVQLSSAKLHTKFGFYNDMYASNFGLMVPSRLSASISSIKAKVYDLESLNRSGMILKPETLDVIVGIPSFDDPTIPPKTVATMKGHVEELTELALKEKINFIGVQNAKEAAQRIINIAA
ncbi:hypothetical protein QQF54_09090 [Lelliottia sp. V106_10]|uniref:hypothetical protein n=1 Tax=Enterobacteriaceae TaxID=543 RepID=UPI00106F8950|nr:MULTISPECIES: hypothetical protein [Enterobacteriaceae]MBM1023153.1 hypothetical protein [Enterobacter sp. E1]MDK9373508.1 hypothetical protein [Lelliottia sp. V106_10]MDK9600451.1 hypothetical protein [Lelliottia sp. V106_5]MEA3564475.1 hypothetical protein [Enterobacter sp. GM-22]MEA3598149.1 hypothetical protein [Enterobacter sp. GM-31]